VPIVSRKEKLSLGRIAQLWADETHEPNVGEAARPLVRAAITGKIKIADLDGDSWFKSQEKLLREMIDSDRIDFGVEEKHTPAELARFIVEDWGDYQRDSSNVVRAVVESPAWRVLSQSAHRVLDRIEVEHLHHGGAENGRLPVTFDDFQRYGIHRHSIAPAIRECQALGFVEITQRGRAGNAEFRSPHYFRLTYLSFLAHEPPTNEWRRIETMEDAEIKCRKARNREPKKQNSSDEKRTNFSGEKRTTKPQFHSGDSATTAMVRIPSLLSISPGGMGVGQSQQSTPAWNDAQPSK
jgi:hypothetical protein